MSAIDIRLFGVVRVCSCPGDPDVNLSPAVQLLLAYLLLHRNAAHSRARLIDVLWRDIEPAQARSRLSTNLWRLRRQIGSETVVIVQGTTDVRLNEAAEINLDVAAFEREIGIFLSAPKLDAAMVAAAEGAIEMASQDLMDGHYCDWVEAERKRLSCLRERALARLVEHHMETGCDEQAIARAGDLLGLDPLREDAHRAVMAAQLRLGRPHLAKRQYDKCRDVLARELGIEPAEETRVVCGELVCEKAVSQKPVDAAPGATNRVAETLKSEGLKKRELVALRAAVASTQAQLKEITRQIDRMLAD